MVARVVFRVRLLKTTTTMNYLRESFVFHANWYNALSRLDDSTKLEMYEAIIRKALLNEPPQLSDVGQIIMSMIEPQIESDYNKWLDVREKRSIAGKSHKGNQHSGLEQMEHLKSNGTNVNTTEQMEHMLSNETVYNNYNNNYNNNVNVNVNDSVNNKEENSKKKDSSADDEFIGRMYKMYPTKCPVRGASLGKCSKDKTRIKNLLKLYSKEDIERVFNREVKEKLGKHPLKNFSTFLNNFPDPTCISDYPKGVDDVKDEDNMPNVATLWDFVEKKTPYTWNNLTGTDKNNGWPKTEEDYREFCSHTVGGTKGFCYVLLVFERDGWEKYYDERGFKLTYRNFIRDNGLLIKNPS